MQSMNTSPDDVGRHNQARRAGEIIYGSIGHSDSVNTGYSYTNTRTWEKQACCGIMSPVRRTFCLFVLFDLVLIFILWVIYTQTCSMSLYQMKCEITMYTFKDSMFDNILCAALRFAPLLLAYALFKIQSPWVVAITTFLTCGFLIAKVFCFNPSQDKGGGAYGGRKNVMTYVVMVVSFIVTWIETWFLDFQVLPKEQAAREKEAQEAQRWHDERSQLIPNYHHGHRDHLGADQFISLPESLEASDDEGGVANQGFRSLPGTRGHSRAASYASLALSLGDQEKEYLDLALEVWDFVWKVHNLESGWKVEAGTDRGTGIVFSQSFNELQNAKLFKLEGILDLSPDSLFDTLHYNLEESPNWNPTVLESRTLQEVDDSTDIVYQVAAEAAGGMVSSRDFVTLRHWGRREGHLISCGKKVSHPDMPPGKKHVRGENGPGGWIFAPVPGQPDQCLFVWLLNTNLKLPGGWVAQSLADRALSGVLMDYLKYMKKHLEDISLLRTIPR